MSFLHNLNHFFNREPLSLQVSIWQQLFLFDVKGVVMTVRILLAPLPLVVSWIVKYTGVLALSLVVLLQVSGGISLFDQYKYAQVKI